MQRAYSSTTIHHYVEVILAAVTAAASVVACVVAGNSLSHVKAATEYVSNKTDLDLIPAVGKPSIYLAIAAACPCIVLSLFIAVVRIHQIKWQQLTDTAGHMIITYLSIFIGVFIIGGLGAAGVLSATSAAVWTNTGDILYNSDNIVASPKFQILASLHCYRAARFLIGTSVSAFIALVMRILLMVYESLLRYWKPANKGYQLCNSELEA